MAVMLVLAGLAALIVGAELLVRGASGLARAVGLPSLIIGLTVVAYGTSAPEFAVGVKAGLDGQADIAVGNAVGSNIFNVLFILGISAIIMPLTVSSQLVRLDVPVMIGVSALTWLLAADGNIGRMEGAAMLLGIFAYTALLIYLGRRNQRPAEMKPADAKPRQRPMHIGLSVLLVVIGLILLVIGSRWLVDGAVGLARMLGVGELIIGLTVVAAGTSMPELATSVVAGIRGERDIAVGNVVGSNIFNLLGVMGGSALAADGGIGVADTALEFDMPVMLAVAVACLPIFFTGGCISRWEGGLFLGYYAAYVLFLIFAAVKHDAAENFGAAMLWFAVPATILGLAASVFFAFRQRRRQSDGVLEIGKSGLRNIKIACGSSAKERRH